jgi:hypothetical protein
MIVQEAIEHYKEHQKTSVKRRTRQTFRKTSGRTPLAIYNCEKVTFF